NVVSPNFLMELPTFRDAGVVTPVTGQVAVAGDYAFIRSGLASCSPGATAIFSVDLSQIVSPVQGGAIQTPAKLPPVYTSSVVSDGMCGGGGDMVMEYPFLFTAAGQHFRAWSVTNPKVPTPFVDIDLSS